MAAMAVVLGLGNWMVIDSDAWAFGQGWVLFTLGFFALAFIIGAIFQSRSAILAQRAQNAATKAKQSASFGGGRGGCGSSSFSCWW